ncbi:uncharacterized protein METZ01_LOCUS431588 [marine metagenome]|uniref:Uncharacterized protein n=1 Tax=marine metagenome TaxID=408172 RepID=A0A382Y691_9ZZZZ
MDLRAITLSTRNPEYNSSKKSSSGLVFLGSEFDSISLAPLASSLRKSSASLLWSSSSKSSFEYDTKPEVSERGL